MSKSKTCEQQARDMLERLSASTHYGDPQRLTGADVVELANLIAKIERLRAELADSNAIAKGAIRAASNNAKQIERLREALQLIRRSALAYGTAKELRKIAEEVLK